MSAWERRRTGAAAFALQRKLRFVSLELAASRHGNDTWRADFVMDALANGRRIKCLTVVDDFSRECLKDIAIDYGMGGQYVTRVLDEIGRFRGYPKAIRTAQGPEFSSRSFMAWTHGRGIQHIYESMVPGHLKSTAE
jgi:putative transposase